jgi:hypothetical protein
MAALWSRRDTLLLAGFGMVIKIPDLNLPLGQALDLVHMLGRGNGAARPAIDDGAVGDADELGEVIVAKPDFGQPEAQRMGTAPRALGHVDLADYRRLRSRGIVLTIVSEEISAVKRGLERAFFQRTDKISFKDINPGFDKDLPR